MGEHDRMPVADAIQTINKFLVGVDCVWGQGYGFDMTILEKFGIQTVWS